MAKERTGYCFKDGRGRWYARLTFTDDHGRRRNLKRRARDEAAARQVLKRLLREVEAKGARALDGARMTFDALADYYEKRYVKPAEYVDGRKVAGLRSAAKAKSIVKILRRHFGKERLPSVTYGEVEHYKLLRLNAPTRSNGQRSIASVNRELAMLRRMLNVAVREGWIEQNPFGKGDPLISLADERKRERILTREEETRLLSACTGRREHLRAIIVAAIDTGCRRGELLKMRWSDVDFAEGIITIRAFNTKTARERHVSITSRLMRELELLQDKTNWDPDALVFGFTDNVKRSFTGARSAASLNGLRFHDLRHTHGSRMDELGFTLAKIGAQLGHTQFQTTLRYVNRDMKGVRQVAEALNALYVEELTEVQEVSEMIN